MLTKMEEAGDVYHGVKLTAHGPNFETAARLQLVDGLLAALGKRFDYASEVVIKASSLLNLRSWPDKDNSTSKHDSSEICMRKIMLKCFD